MLYSLKLHLLSCNNCFLVSESITDFQPPHIYVRVIFPEVVRWVTITVATQSFQAVPSNKIIAVKFSSDTYSLAVKGHNFTDLLLQHGNHFFYELSIPMDSEKCGFHCRKLPFYLLFCKLGIHCPKTRFIQ